jgi:alkanesulfonate monooxygenase SsuD/methylene tetrahydromethanopterin reductase-like flavin-dependent oxidoreductase (luciferase family)
MAVGGGRHHRSEQSADSSDPERLRKTSVLGTASEVRAKLEAILESTPMTELITVMQLPGLDPAKARRSLDRFGADVLPHLK